MIRDKASIENNQLTKHADKIDAHNVWNVQMSECVRHLFIVHWISSIFFQLAEGNHRQDVIEMVLFIYCLNQFPDGNENI